VERTMSVFISRGRKANLSILRFSVSACLLCISTIGYAVTLMTCCVAVQQPGDVPLSEFRAFGKIQVYRTNRDVWVFLDVDSVEVPGTKQSSPVTRSPICEQREFHAYVLDENGLKQSWKSQGNAISAHPGETVFFQHSGYTFAYVFQANKLYRWQSSKDNIFSFVLLTDARMVRALSGEGFSRAADGLLTISEANGFLRDGTGQYGWGKYPEDDFLSDSLNLRIHFVRQKGGFGWRSIVAESLDKPPRWKTVLLRLETRNDDEDRIK